MLKWPLFSHANKEARFVSKDRSVLTKHQHIVPGLIEDGLPEGTEICSKVLEDVEKHLDRIRAMVAKEGVVYAPNPAWEKLPVFDEGRFPPKNLADPPPVVLSLRGPIAEILLVLHNDLNRPMIMARVYNWAVEMLTNRWMLSHQGIAFDTEGQFTDGQNRALAVYLAHLIDPRVCVAFWVFFNCDPKTRNIVDVGQARTLSDKAVMELKQEQGINFENGHYRGLGVKKLMNVVNAMPSMQGRTDTKGQNIRKEFYKKNIDLVADVLTVLAKKGKITIRYNATWAGAFLEAAYYYGKDVVLPIAQRLIDGNFIQYSDSSKLDPMHALLNRLQLNQLPGAKRLKPTAMSACAIYFIRKALMEAPVPCRQGAKHFAKYKVFISEEAKDYLLHGKNSKILKNYSVADYAKVSDNAKPFSDEDE